MACLFRTLPEAKSNAGAVRYCHQMLKCNLGPLTTFMARTNQSTMLGRAPVSQFIKRPFSDCDFRDPDVALPPCNVTCSFHRAGCLGRASAMRMCPFSNLVSGPGVRLLGHGSRGHLCYFVSSFLCPWLCMNDWSKNMSYLSQEQGPQPPSFLCPHNPKSRSVKKW